MTDRSLARRGIRLFPVFTVVLCVAGAPSAARAGPADFGLESVAASLSTSQAGAHPDLSVAFALRQDPASQPNAFGLRAPFAPTRDLRFELPPGLIGDPGALADSQLCTTEELVGWESSGGCPNGSQVGVLTVLAHGLSSVFVEPVYAMTPPGDAVARLGLVAGIYPTFVEVGVRTRDRSYGQTLSVEGVSAQGNLVEARLDAWGIPADPAHDTERMTPEEAFEGAVSSPPRPPGSRRLPFLTNPTRCGVPLSLAVSAASWFEPGRFDGKVAPLGSISGCNHVPFGPELTLATSSRAAAALTGLELAVRLPGPEGTDVPASSQARELRLQLPGGMALAPAAADGLVACGAEQAGLGTEESSHCPDAARLGTAEFEIPGLGDAVGGSLALRTPAPGDPYRLWVLVDEPGVRAKLPADLVVDPRTGQVEAVALELPQVPLREARLRLDMGSRGPLVNPPACGVFAGRYELVPWSGNPAASGTVPVAIDRNCPVAGFAPALSAGTTNPVAGAESPFVLRLSRRDREPNVSGLSVSLPLGIAARFGGVPLCPDALAAIGTCPAASRVGSAAVAAGAGARPLWIPQPGASPASVYLAGPYRGGPFSFVVVVPALAGPFDLGTVVDRAAIQIDPTTAAATVHLDPLPQILGGVPIEYRTLALELDRSGFVVNPTGCEPSAIAARVTSAGNDVADASVPFAAVDCAELDFRPRLELRFGGAVGRNGHPTVGVVLRPRGGDANVRAAAVLLPRGVFLDQSRIRGVCARAEFAAGDCPANSAYGRIEAWSPLIGEPLRGRLYLRESARRLPDLAAELSGRVRLVLSGRLDTPHARVRASFDRLPDVPLARLRLLLRGGGHGILVNSRGLCARRFHANALLAGHNGKRRRLEPPVRASCGERDR